MGFLIDAELIKSRLSNVKILSPMPCQFILSLSLSVSASVKVSPIGDCSSRRDSTTAPLCDLSWASSRDCFNHSQEDIYVPKKAKIFIADTGSESDCASSLLYSRTSISSSTGSTGPEAA